MKKKGNALMARHEPFMDRHEERHIQDDDPYLNHRRNAAPRSSGDYADDALGYDDPYGDEPYGLVDRILAAPGRLAMSTVALVAFAVVGVNAAYLQPGAHPAPLLSTRGEAPAQPLPAEPSFRSQRPITMAPAPAVRPVGNDGTTASIRQQQDTIASLLTRPPYTVPAPIPRPAFSNRAPVSAAPARPVETIAVNDPIGALLAPVVAANPTNGTNQPLPAAEIRSSQPVVAAVQAILAEMGYAPGSIDGVIGPSTEEAIRRFQLRRALEPNGQINADLLREIERVTGTRIAAS